MKPCYWFFHKWLPWGQPFEVRFRHYPFIGLEPIESVANFQQRTCERCGQVQERKV